MGEQGAANVVPLERQADVAQTTEPSTFPLPPLELASPKKPSWPTLAALAIATGIAAVGLGAWAVFSEVRSTPETATGPTVEWSLAVLADSSAQRYPLQNSVGRIALVIDEGDRAVLTLDGLGPAPDGSIYQAWLVPAGSATATSVATFDGSDRVIPLTLAVPPGARVGVTLEPVGGSDRPSRTLRLVAVRA